MRRHLLLSALAAALLMPATATFAQDSYGYRPYDDRYDSGRYESPYVRPYPQPNPGYAPYPYEQRAQRYGGGLRILEAWYGRERRICDASHAMRSACEGQPGCTVKAGNELCGDPLPNVVKGLSVTYRCHGQTRRVDQMESRLLSLRCD